MPPRGPRAPAVQQAFVLHHYDWSETSLVLDLFTREQGRLAVVAKGAKRPYSQLRAVLLPFQRIQVSLSKPAKGTEGAAEVVTLRGAEWAGGATMPAGAALFSGYYLNELLLKLLARQDPHPALFDAYAQTLPQLHASEDVQSQAALRAFELRLLMELGLLPDLSLSSLTQAPLDLQRHYMLSPESGVVAPAADSVTFTGATLVQLQAALLHGSMAALQQSCAPVLPALKTGLRALLHYHLGHKPLRTRQVMLDVQKLLD
ncbi:DNA repair protein RecO [Paucibacter sp. O1-1]|uniref:DNA repair protein RecO n=1 Tax=Paucibacter sp. M5-1 TaxID=3015998 RepID=UPI0021D4BDE8|nr:DNA repair protein RecO [Paucibacter sp. M5-1]MCU7373308.1 DNA repair protein RecO [Paucibacter sp. O1-1]MCZ7879603.1 DNA repair protein RecO [Paucibacter sp. M5-1]MDA3828307.1 DNA repair protein RecO [Paucibacter sp. O1-1]